MRLQNDLLPIPYAWLASGMDVGEYEMKIRPRHVPGGIIARHEYVGLEPEMDEMMFPAVTSPRGTTDCLKYGCYVFSLSLVAFKNVGPWCLSCSPLLAICLIDQCSEYSICRVNFPQ